MNASERMEYLLEKKGKTKKELAEYLGISYNTVRIWKNKQPIPSAEHLVAISEFLGVSVKYLLTGEAEEYQECLAPDEKELISNYLKLNELRRAEVLWYVKTLAESNKGGE